MATSSKASTPVEGPPTGLRDRARRAIRDEVAEVAMALFLEHGFDETTVDQICAAAGLSRSSFFRYFPTKEDVVLTSTFTYGYQIAEFLRQRPDHENPWIALSNAFDALAQAWTDADETNMQLRWSSLITNTPSIRARWHERTQAWRPLLVPEIARRLGLGDETRDPRPAAIFGAVMSCAYAASDIWVASDGSESVITLFHRALDAVRPSCDACRSVESP